MSCGAWLGKRYDRVGRRVYAGLLSLAALLGAASAAASAAAQSPRITALEVEGLHQLTAETVLFYLGLEVGGPLDEDALNRGFHELWSRELVEDVTVEVVPDEVVPDKVALDDTAPPEAPSSAPRVRVVVHVVERPRLLSVEYEGLDRISKADLTDRILTENIEVQEGTPLARGELRRVQRAIEELYRDKGYRFATARYRLEEVQPHRYRATFTVDEGRRVRIGEVDFTGNEVIGELPLQWRMKHTRETNLVNRLLKKDIYHPGKLEEDLARIRDAYRRKGYKNVTVGEPEIEIRERGSAVSRGQIPPKPSRRRLEITIPLEEGERWRLGDITLHGNETFSDQQLLAAFEIRRGAWLRSKKIEEGLEALDTLYQNRGFLFARIEPEIRERDSEPGEGAEERIADLVVRITENDRYTVGRIRIEGNHKTRDKVLRRELRLQEGFVMNTGAVRNSVFKINQLGFFQLDTEEPVSFEVDRETKEVHLTFHGEEAERTELQFGGGWNDSFGLEGQVSVRTSNFLGRGETLGIQLARGEFRDLLDLSYFVPWFLDRPQTVGIRVFDQDRFFEVDDQDFDQRARGYQLSYGRSRGLFQSVSVAYQRVDQDQLFTVLELNQDTQEDERVPVEIRQRVASVRPSWVYDSRDSRFEPTRGRRIAASVEYADDALGGDLSLVRPELSFSLFQPMSRLPLQTVFAFNVEAGWVDNLGETVLTPSQRFFLGGESSIRGHRTGTLFVRDQEGRRRVDPFGFALGGDRRLQLNLEAHALLGGPVRLLWYLDAGNVWDSEFGVDVTDLRATTGLELRLTVPMFGAPLRLIYAHNLDPIDEVLDVDTGAVLVPGDDFRSFQLNIGTTF